jgi:anti-sigma factor RsiW
MLDGEATATETAAADAHLAGCRPCRVAADRAARATRLLRVRVAERPPDPASLRGLVDAALARPPDPGARPPRLTLVGGSGGPGCGCSADCRCGCRQGRACRCGHRAA